MVFPHEGKLVTIDQLNFTRRGHLETNQSTVPLVDQVKPATQSLGAGMYSSLMGTFDIPAPINYLGSTSVGKYIGMVIDRTDPWILPTNHKTCVPLSAVEVACQAIVNTTVDPILTPSTVSKESEEAYFPAWEENSLYSNDFLDMFFPLDEAILESMSV